MEPEMFLLTSFIAALVGALFPLAKGVLADVRLRPGAKRFFDSRVGSVLLGVFGLESKSDSPERLFEELSEASTKMDSVLARIEALRVLRKSAIEKLETQLLDLTTRKGDLTKQIEQLQKIPLPAMDYFMQSMRKQEKSSSVRDYVLFIAGVLVSAIVAVVLKHYGLA
jgi:hypothetical protein